MKRDAVNVEVRRSRRKSISLEITPRGTILLRAPLYMTDRSIRKFLEEKQDWITQALKRRERSMEQQAENPARVLTQQELKTLTENARKDLTKRCEYWAPKVGVTYGRIAIRHQKTRWGSCSSKGNLNFNCLLEQMPEEIRDYVVVHELCHRREMNHSAAFWREVERVLPEYRRYRTWLKKEGAAYLRMLPVEQ